MKKATVLITPSSGGKDYFLEILEKELKKENFETINIKFATMVRKIVQKQLFKKIKEKEKLEIKSSLKEFLEEEIFDIYKNKYTDFKIWKGKNVRETLQYIAENLKKIDKNIHIAFALKDILNSESNQIPIITDCRFENEMITLLNYNQSKNKENYIKKYILKLNLPKEEKIKEILKEILEIENNKEDEYILKEVLKEVLKLYKYLNQKNNKYQEEENSIFEIQKFKTKEDFFKENIIILTRYIVDEDIKNQRKQYKEHGINFENPEEKFLLKNGEKRYLGSANPNHPSEELAFELPEGYYNATNSPNLKDNLLPEAIKKYKKEKNIKKKKEKSSIKNKMKK